MVDNTDVEIAKWKLLDFYINAAENSEGYPIADIYYVFSGICRRAALKAARKQLPIKSYQKDGVQYWKWDSDKKPKEFLIGLEECR